MDLGAGLNQRQTIVSIRTEPTFNARTRRPTGSGQASESDLTDAEVSDLTKLER